MSQQGLTPRGRAAPRNTQPRRTLQRGALDNEPRGRVADELWYNDPRDSLHNDSTYPSTPRAQAGPRARHTRTPNNVQARFALIGGPHVWGLASRFLSDWKPSARHLQGASADGCLGRPPTVSEDTDTLIVLRDIDRKHVQVHPAAPELDKVRSQEVLLQRNELRDSNNSGYYSTGSNQHPPSQPQHTGPSTAGSSTSVSSPGSTWPPASSGSRVSSSRSASSELLNLHRRSVSSTGLELMGWHGRVSMEDDGVVRVITGTRFHQRRPRPLGRSKTC